MVVLNREDISKDAVDSPTKPWSLSLATMVSCSILDVKKGPGGKVSWETTSGSPIAGPGIMLVHSSAGYEGFMCGDPIADDEVLWTDAPDSEDADS
jgi:hypothetical protein